MRQLEEFSISTFQFNILHNYSGQVNTHAAYCHIKQSPLFPMHDF